MFQRLTRTIEIRLGKLFTRRTHPREPIEVKRDIVEEIRAQAQFVGEGRYTFPYTRVEISVLAHDGAARGVFEELLQAGALNAEIAEELNDLRCNRLPNEVSVRIVSDATETQNKPYHINYWREQAPESVAPHKRPRARLVVLAGDAEEYDFQIQQDVVNLGRNRNPTTNGEIVRVNHIAFRDSESSVSRRHAQVKYDAANGVFRLLDGRTADESCTFIFRDGRRFACDFLRGQALRNGDELILGGARLRFELPDEAG